MKIAAWSGPRNLSTAMMYAFAARGDTEALDEPFYAAFLAHSGLRHPMHEAVVRSQPADPEAVAAALAAGGALPHRYAKLMAHHMEGMPLGWAGDWAHVHLIRHPARVIASYEAKREGPTEADLGFAAQATLHDRLGGVIVDTSALREDPEGMLRTLCAALGLEWTDRMLGWEAGPKPFDGAWAPHWYGAVHRSTGFAGAEGPLPAVERRDLLDACLPFYEAMRSRALVA
ncbi:sulfotransferase [Jannaschia sp. W003]|uniref:sulfotransferase n=1 Tax=Jannaschia sp. W003 TaxID=2867012 RepID=UPI0021A8C327|nr:sulfotransferase [Jannaschia sp. W003]UWQ22177.1 sulfotransferase [Jannaschia sp. W003]